MKSFKVILLFSVAPFFLSTGIKQHEEPKTDAADIYSGTVTWIKTSKSAGLKKWDEHGKENAQRWNFFFEFKITANFNNGKGTVVRLDRTTKWGKDSLIFVHPEDKYMIQETTNIIDCSGQGEFDLTVEFSEDKKNYWISFFTPDCRGQVIYEVTNNIHGNISNPSVNEQTGQQITLPANFTGQPVGTNPDDLSGTFNEVIPAPNDPGGGEIITTATWNLSKGQSKMELIVSPYGDDADYDAWMPEPGANESIQGNILNINLRLQETGGSSPRIKAKAFELHLVNTSRQPGICINAPLNPSPPKPDLLFLPQDGATISQEGQFMKIPCEDGENGEVVIGSFDGGGWTILNAEAILQNNTRIKGVLVSDKSKKDIPVPKNNSGGKIAERWLADNGRPAETDDKESSAGNTNNGDGLSAYEEYRGVFSEGGFKRLDPNSKELGVKIKKADISIFADGIQKFENVTGFKVVRFLENEIPASRRINQNGSHANTYKQFVLNLVTGTLPGNQSGKAFGSPGIPSDVNPVMIDLNAIHQTYQDRQAEARRMNTTLPYAENELLTSVVAHELAHGVNASHHGPGPNPPIILNNPVDINSNPAGRIYLYTGAEYTDRPYTVSGQAGIPGNQQSGDLNCIMALNFLCEWAVHETPAINYFFEVPIIPLGLHLCNSKTGTGINSGGKYFGDATNGKCAEQLKLK